jgi:hypothetical protein
MKQLQKVAAKLLEMYLNEPATERDASKHKLSVRLERIGRMKYLSTPPITVRQIALEYQLTDQRIEDLIAQLNRRVKRYFHDKEMRSEGEKAAAELRAKPESEWSSIKIVELPIPVRLQYALRNAGIEDVAQLASCNESRVLRMKNVSDSSLARLKELGIRFAAS